MARPEDGTPPSPDPRGPLTRLAARLSEVRDGREACEMLVDHLRQVAPASSVRAFLLGPGDRCATCPRARDCSSRDRCFHLAAGSGLFAQPAGHAERVPRLGTPWADALALAGSSRAPCPPELLPPRAAGAEAPASFVPLKAGGEALGVVGVRVPEGSAPIDEGELSAAALLTAAAVGAATSRAEEHRRFDQLLLVNGLGRRVNSLLNLDLVMRHAVVEIQRSFGYRHVTLFVVDRASRRITLQAQASRYQRTEPTEGSIEIGQGIVGQVAAKGRTIRVDDVSRDAGYVNWWPDTKSEVAVPVPIGGVVEAVLNVESDVFSAFSEADVLVLETAALQLATAIDNARLFGRVQESEEEYRTLIEGSTVAVLRLDTRGRVAYVNPAASDLTGLDRHTMLARLSDPAELAVPEDRPRFEMALAAAEGGEPQRGVEIRTAHADGRTRFLTVEIQPLVSDGGARKGALVLARDVSREKELQRQLHQSEKLKAMGEMVSGVAHELNNPLAGILGYAQLLLTQPASEWSRGDLEKIEVNARRCRQIVANLLTFARQSRTSRQAANVNQVIESVITLNEYQFRLDSVEMLRQFDPRVPAVPIDVSGWQRVFINLAQNAREAMVEAGTPKRRITFTTRYEAPEIVVRVEDTGPGIPREVIGRVFDPFFTTREQGTGLGLGLCYGIVTDHGGTISVESDPGHGACFTIRLPATPAAATLPAEPPPVPLARPAPAGPPRRLLVVDDEVIVRELARDLFERQGYRVDLTGDANEALGRLDATPYSVVLTDLLMPGELDGLGLQRRVAERRPALARRFVFMTGEVRDGSVDEIRRLGLRYVRKPFDIRELARVVNEVAAAEEPAAGATGATARTAT